jgi:tetratricopeptide (TPR) repeat protein
MNRHRAGRFTMFVSLAAIAAAVALASTAARAAPAARKPAKAVSPADQAAAVEAREHFERGEAFFKLEKYKEALEQYEQGYLAKADPSFLYNIAQCHRLMGDKPAALRFYKRFLNEATHVPNRPIVEQHIKELEASLADEAPMPAPPPEPLPSAPPPVAPAADLLAQPAAPPAGSASRDGQPIYKKWWFWTIVGAVAVGGGVGAYLATRSSSGCEAGRVCM